MNIEVVISDNFVNYSDKQKQQLYDCLKKVLGYMSYMGDIYNIHNKESIMDYINKYPINNYKSRNNIDDRKIVMKYIEKSITSGVAKEDVLISLSNNDKTYIAILIDIDNNQNNCYIRNKENLIQLKCSHHLKKMTKHNFIQCCKNIFDNLIYSISIEDSIRSISKAIKDKKNVKYILEHLSVLNCDTFNENKWNKSNLELEKILSKLDCSKTGSRDKVPTFDFIDTQNIVYNIKCELHTKLNTNKDDCIRIYFHPGKQNMFDEKVLIGHIGKHL